MAPTAATKARKSAKALGQTPYAASLNGAHAPIVCTSRQSRFHTETIDSQEEIDLKTVNIAIGDRELLVDADLKLKAGVKYALIGRNGTGKSTLLQAIARKLIPGIGQKIRILLLSQIEDATGSLDIVTESGNANGGVASAESKLTALEHVVRGDAERLRLLQEAEGKCCCRVRRFRANVALQHSTRRSNRARQPPCIDSCLRDAGKRQNESFSSLTCWPSCAPVLAAGTPAPSSSKLRRPRRPPRKRESTAPSLE